MSKSIKFKDNTYWDSKGIVYSREPLSDILDNYKIGKARKNTVVDSYVRLFKFDMWAIWKNTSILFYLNDTQADAFSQLVNFSVKKRTNEEELLLHTFKTIRFKGDITSQLVAVVTSTNTIEVYFKMAQAQSPTINILSIAKLDSGDEFGTITLDCDTVVSTLPVGTKIYVSNII